MTRADTVDDLLAAVGLSLEDFARKAGVTRRTLFAARTGGPVARITVAKLAKALRISAAAVRAAIAASRAAAQ